MEERKKILNEFLCTFREAEKELTKELEEIENQKSLGVMKDHAYKNLKNIYKGRIQQNMICILHVQQLLLELPVKTIKK